ncbi:MAG TPA: hypothetical protein VL860_10315 [Planctomycetota bacterium]|nr:hypothetical protein [Planctomycetota bacterium]
MRTHTNRPSARPAVMLAAVFLLATALLVPCAAQNELPHDTPTPLDTTADKMPVKTRVAQLLGAPENEPIARYLAADATHRPAVLGTLLKNVDKSTAQLGALVERLNALTGTPQASAELLSLPEPEFRLYKAQRETLVELEQRLKIRRLVLQLGARKFTERDAAVEQLRQLGRAAYDDLAWGTASTDLEIADTCVRLLVMLRGRGFIGISFSMIPPALSSEEAVEKKLPFVGGVSIDQVIDRQAGDRAGLKPGDVIIGLGPMRIVTFSDLLRTVATLGPSFSGPISFVREGKIQTVRIQLGLNTEMQ